MAMIPQYGEGGSFVGLQDVPDDQANKPFSLGPIDPSFFGKQVTLWGNTPYTIQGANDPVMQALQAFNAGVPQSDLGQYFSDPTVANQVYSHTLAHNDATRNDESTLFGLPTPVVLAAAGMGAGAFFGLGGAAGGAAVSGGLEAGASPFLSGLDAGAVANADYAGMVGGGMDSASAGATAGGALMPAAIPEADPTFGGVLSQTGAGSFENVDNISSFGSMSTSGPAGSSFLDSLKNLGPQGLAALKSLLGGKAGGLLGGGDGLDLAARTAPGIAALAYANKQPGLDVGPLKGILSGLGGNQDAVIRAATDPFQQNIAAGYGDILRSQGLRGIRGSSFGDTDIANYISTTGRSLANAGANAAEGSLTLQGTLASNIAQLQNQAQQIKNSLYGRAFDVLGRGVNPTGYGMRTAA